MAGTQGLLFSDAGLSPQMALTLRRHNPWWEGDPMPPQPGTRRHLVARVRRLLEAEIAPIVEVSGPRQVGKTTAQFQMIVLICNAWPQIRTKDSSCSSSAR